MINLVKELQTAVFQALQAVKSDADVLTAIGDHTLGVYTHVPDQTSPPFLQVGRITTEPDNMERGQFETMTVEVFACWRGAGKTPIMAILHAARVALCSGDLSTELARFSRIYLTRYTDDLPVDNGSLYFGMIELELWAEPIDQ